MRDVAKLSDRQSSNALSRAEKGAEVRYQWTEENADGLCHKESNNNFRELKLDAPVDKVFTVVDIVPLENLSLRKGDFAGNSSAAPSTPPPQTRTTELLSTSQSPTPESDRPIASSQPTWHAFHSSAATLGLHAGLATVDMPVLSERRNLAPRDGLASLSFYDDLLKSISSERMMYASSLSKQGRMGPQLLQFGGDVDRRESNNLSTNGPSIALCSPIPLSSISGSDYDETDEADRPVHPFDMNIRRESSATLRQQPQRLPMQENNLTMAASDMYFHPRDNLDVKGRPEPTLLTKLHSQAYLPTVLSRSGSFHSQEEAIENWRIHVAPSSPPIMPELNYDRQNLEREGTGDSTPSSGMRAGYVYDNAIERSHTSRDTFGYTYEESNSRRGTIPIILSSHVHEETESYQEEQGHYLSANDLHLPRPSYTCGQMRTQRQGSVNSSIGGYNYSVASSPSLADSLSNPMYQQQSYGIMMNNTMFPRPMPGRKGSLPTSVYGSIREELVPRAQYQASQPYTPPHLAYAGPTTRVRTRTPSHLSNMVNHWDDNFSHDDETSGGDGPHASGCHTPPSIHKKSHFRSQSHEHRSNTQGSGSSWGHFGLFKEAQAGYASLVDPPPSSMSKMMFQERSQDDDVVTGPRTIMTTANSSMSFKEALEIVDPTQRCLSTHMQESQVIATRLFDGEIVNHLVHPLDLSPLLLQPQTGKQRKCHDRPSTAAAHSTLDYTSNRKSCHSETQAAWDEACIGLGLTFSHENPTTSSPSAPRSEGNFLRRPIPVKQPMNYSTNRNDYNQWEHDRHDMITRMTFGTTTMTATTELSDSATLTNPYQRYMTNYTVVNDYEKDATAMTPPYYEPQRQEQQRQTSVLVKERFSETNIQAIQRQPSQRNRKNLVVNIAPLMNS
ncbi:hypothetical protein BGZ58_008034 [Dissophora ornata]|nr:hypothetical protein BGZ58_008034 [Dissophora ornata]